MTTPAVPTQIVTVDVATLERIVRAAVAAELAKLEHDKHPERLLSSKEAGEYLGGISDNAVRILVSRGKLRSVKLGSRLLFRVADLEEALAA